MKKLFNRIAEFFRSLFKRSASRPSVPIVYPQKPKSTFRVQIGDLIRICPGKHHAWYESNVGPIRKPI